MRVVVADSVVVVDSLPSKLLSVGKYTRIERKSSEELSEERARLRASGSAKHPIKFKHISQQLIIEDARQGWLFPPGLWPSMRAAMIKGGFRFSVVDRRNKSIRPDPAYGAVAGVSFRPGQLEALALIAASDCGIIKCPTAWGKSFLISRLCQIFPTLRIVVATATAQVVGSLFQVISGTCPGQVGYLYQRGDTTAGKRIICCTLKSLEKVPPDRVDLLLVDECHGVGDNKAGEVVAGFRFCRKFGFSASPIRNDGTTKVMEALLGPVILDIPYQSAVASNMVVPIRYVLLPCNKGPRFLRDVAGPDGARVRKDLPEVLRKRYTYWKNDGRNKLVADCVHRLLAADPNLQILIMVETLQHAILLNQLLPNFIVAHYGATDVEKFKSDKKLSSVQLSRYSLKPKELDRIRNAFAKGTLKRVISTFVFKQGVDFKGLSVVVRADGRVSKIDGIQIPGRVARTSAGKEVGYVVDVLDTQDEWALARAKQRQALYRQIGWEEVTEEEMLNDFRRGANGGGTVIGESSGTPCE